MIHYLLDENVDDALRRGLHSRHPDMIVWRIGDPAAPPIGATDPEILLWCEANDFSLVTNNRDTMPGHLHDHCAAGRHIPGIFTLSASMAPGETVEELALIWAVSEPGEFSDQITYLPLR